MFNKPIRVVYYNWLLLGCGLGLALHPAPSHAVPTPNIILAMADDMGWGDPGYNGNPVIRTPNLDLLSTAGLRFDRFYAPTVCSPTRGSCMTGRHPYRYGIFSANVGHLPHDERTIAEALKTRAYVTGHFGKWHLGTLTRTEPDSNRGGPRGAAHYSPPWDHGFDRTFSTESRVPTWDPMLQPEGKVRQFWDALSDPTQGAAFGTAYWSGGRRVPVEELRGDDSKLIMDRALQFIGDAAKAKKPFLAVIWFHAPHLPVVAGPKYAKLYQRASAYERNYYGCVTALDDQMGRLRKTLRELGVAENTMLWFCSDNGPEGKAGQAPGSAGPLKGRKRDLWEGGIRVPGLLEWPAVIKQPRVVSVPCVTSDYFPTILDYAGVLHTNPLPIDGISLRPLIEGQMAERPKPIGLEFGNMAAWLDNRYKLVALFKGGGAETDEDGTPAEATEKKASTKAKGKVEASTKELRKLLLFDIVADPKEEKDLAAEKPALVESMHAALEAWRESCRQSLAGKDYL